MITKLVINKKINKKKKRKERKAYLSRITNILERFMTYSRTNGISNPSTPIHPPKRASIIGIGNIIDDYK